MSLQDTLTHLIENSPAWLGITLLGASACLEYIFPPIPGDVLVIAGGILVVRRGWPGLWAFFAILVGSMLGMFAMTLFGRVLMKRKGPLPFGLARFQPQLDAVLAQFRRRGAMYIAINRFLPSLRALFFIAAGMAELPLWQVLLFGGLSALLWNGMLWLVAAKLGENWSAIGHFFRVYGYAAWAVVGVLVLVWLVRSFRKTRRENGR